MPTNVTIADLMASPVMTATPSQTAGHVRDVMQRHGISTMPVVDDEHKPLGMVGLRDILGAERDQTPVRSIMSEKVFSIPEYAGSQVAARMMRNHRIHHLAVTREQQLVGIISAFDLLKLVENHRYVARNAPSTPRKRGARGRSESPAG